jgi:hypothetical protein
LMFPDRQLLFGLLLAVMGGLAAHPASAQSQERNTRLEIPRGDSARSYAERTRFTRIQNDIFYIDELNEPIPMNGLPRFRRQEPAVEQPEPGISIPLSDAARWSWFMFFAVIVAVVLFIAIRYGGNMGGSFRKAPDGQSSNRRAARSGPRKFVPETPTDILLDKLRSMEDRREALVELIEHLLPAAAHQNDLRVSRAETARDIIRRLPAKWTLLPELNRIVMTEELVQFGGRELPERTFEDCLRRAAPILNGAMKPGMAA